MKEQLAQMQKMINAGKLGHAYLFYGKNNEALFEFALNFAGILLGEKNIDKITKNLELHIIDQKEETDIKIEKIRYLISYMALSARDDGFKVALVKDADKMNKNASNAILKVLEEPKKNKILILTSSSPGILLPTVLSRVQKIEVLTKQSNNVINDLTVIEQLNKLLASSVSDRFNIVEKISKDEGIIHILDIWLSFFHDLIYLKTNCKELIKNGSYVEYLDQASLKYSRDNVQVIIEKILNTKPTVRVGS